MVERGQLALVVRRTIRASPERIFDAWTTPEQLVCWWGPPGVRCTAASVDLRVGGTYRIDHRMPDGSALSIVGTFSAVERPRRLAYTWRTTADPTEAADSEAALERVEVRFETRAEHTEVIVVHERIPSALVRDRHEGGWQGCLAALAQLLTPA